MKQILENISLYSFILMSSLGGCLLSTLLYNGEQSMMQVLDWLFIRVLIIGSLSSFSASKILLMLMNRSDKERLKSSKDILDDFETLSD